MVKKFIKIIFIFIIFYFVFSYIPYIFKNEYEDIAYQAYQMATNSAAAKRYAAIATGATVLYLSIRRKRKKSVRKEPSQITFFNKAKLFFKKCFLFCRSVIKQILLLLKKSILFCIFVIKKILLFLKKCILFLTFLIFLILFLLKDPRKNFRSLCDKISELHLPRQQMLDFIKKFKTSFNKLN